MKSSKIKITGVLVMLLVLGLTCMCSAQDKAGKSKELKAEVVSITGVAKYRLTTDKKIEWKPLKVKDTLSQFAIIRTGLGSQVVLHFADRGKVTIDRLTVVGISQFNSVGGKDGKVTARIGLKYGSMRMKVDKTRGTNDFSVATPVATCSVRGTDGKISYTADAGMYLFGTEGTWSVAKSGKRKFVKAGQRTDGKLASSAGLKDRQRDVQLGDPFGGLTKTETRNLYYYGGGRGIIGFVGNPGATATGLRFTRPKRSCSIFGPGHRIVELGNEDNGGSEKIIIHDGGVSDGTDRVYERALY